MPGLRDATCYLASLQQGIMQRKSQGRQGGTGENSLGYRGAIRCIQPCGQLHSKSDSGLLSACQRKERGARLVIHTL